MSAEQGIDDGIQALRTAITAPEVRIELSFAFTAQGVVPVAQLYVKSPRDRWVKADDLPLILPPENGNRADLLRLFADLVEDEMATTGGTA